jgi:hypothetical protein
MPAMAIAHISFPDSRQDMGELQMITSKVWLEAQYAVGPGRAASTRRQFALHRLDMLAHVSKSTSIIVSAYTIAEYLDF